MNRAVYTGRMRLPYNSFDYEPSRSLMVEDLSLLASMALVLGVALGAGLLLSLLKLPMILGYLVAGIVIGPYVLGLVEHIEDVEMLATIGVVLLMFTLGLELSPRTLRRVGKVAILGGAVQIAATTALGFAIGFLFDWSIKESVLFGFFISMSSTVIVMKLLLDRGDLGSTHGRIMIGMLLIQDLSVVPIMAVLPSLEKSGMTLLADLGWALLKADAFLVAVLVLGGWGLPRLVRRVVIRRSRELFLLAVVCVCFGAGFAAYHLGLSIALGAFLAGLLLSESDYAHQARADIRPLRDVFSVLFFVALGMLADPSFIADNPGKIAIVVTAVVLGKLAIVFLVLRGFGQGAKTGLFAGSGLFQIGEFSFVLAALALSEHLISDDLYATIMATAFITILLTPFAMTLAAHLYYRAIGAKGFPAEGGDALEPPGGKPSGLHPDRALSNHVVMCGYGKVARYLGQVLEQRGFSYLVIDLDPDAVDLARKRGVPAVFGDACDPEILAQACLERARVLIVGFADPIATKLIIRNARRINRRIDIVARAYGDEETKALRAQGASEVVRPDLEVGLEIVRHTLHRFGMTPQEIQYVLSKLREEF